MSSMSAFVAAGICLAQLHGASAMPVTASEVIAVNMQTIGSYLMKGFVSYSIEFAFFPDYAGNLSNPNTFSNNLLDNIGYYQGSKPMIRVGGTSQDNVLYNSSLQIGYNASYSPSYSADQPYLFEIGKRFFESFDTFNDTQYIYGFNFASNTSFDRQLLLDSVPFVCKAMRHGKLEMYELGNEPDLYTAFPSYPLYTRRIPADWNEQTYVNQWLNGTRAIRETMNKTCPKQANDKKYKYYAPSFAGTGGNPLNPVQTFYDGLDSDNTVGMISSHNYISGATVLGVTLQGTLMNHTSTVASVAPHLNESNLLARYGLPYVLGETNSLYGQGRPALSNTFGAALWVVDFNLWCATNNISRVHMHQGTSYRYQSWQPVQPRNSNGTTIGTKAPYYGNIATAAALGDITSGHVRVANLPLTNETEAAYAIYHKSKLARIAVINMMSYNGTENSTPAMRPNATYTFQVPRACKGSAGIRRLLANGSDAITGATFDGYSYNYELNNGKPVLLGNVTRGENATVAKGGIVQVTVPWSTAAILDLNC